MARIERIHERATYQQHMALFQQSLTNIGTDEGRRRADFSDDYGPNHESYRRYVAFADNNDVLGCMVLKRNQDAANANQVQLKIDGICVHTANSAGVAKQLLHAAVGQSWDEGLGGRLSLTDCSGGRGVGLYVTTGFHHVDVQTGKMVRTPEAGERADNFREVIESRRALGAPLWLQVLESEDNAWASSVVE